MTCQCSARKHACFPKVANEAPQPHGGQQIPASASYACDKYAATAVVASRVFYLQFRIELREGRTFNGRVGDIASPGGGALTGDLYTNDFPRLCRETVKFEFQSTSAYTALRFFDATGNVLGNLKGTALSSPAGMGVGSGNWS